MPDTFFVLLPMLSTLFLAAQMALTSPPDTTPVLILYADSVAEVIRTVQLGATADGVARVVLPEGEHILPGSVVAWQGAWNEQQTGKCCPAELVPAKPAERQLATLAELFSRMAGRHLSVDVNEAGGSETYAGVVLQNPPTAEMLLLRTTKGSLEVIPISRIDHVYPGEEGLPKLRQSVAAEALITCPMGGSTSLLSVQYAVQVPKQNTELTLDGNKRDFAYQDTMTLQVRKPVWNVPPYLFGHWQVFEQAFSRNFSAFTPQGKPEPANITQAVWENPHANPETFSVAKQTNVWMQLPVEHYSNGVHLLDVEAQTRITLPGKGDLLRFLQARWNWWPTKDSLFHVNELPFVINDSNSITITYPITAAISLEDRLFPETAGQKKVTIDFVVTPQHTLILYNPKSIYITRYTTLAKRLDYFQGKFIPSGKAHVWVSHQLSSFSARLRLKMR